jgi:metal-responsive CopG/Arc/MetJ family transcriptional regulator
MKNTQISFDEQFLKLIDRVAAETNKTRSAIVREAVRFWLKQKEIDDFEGMWIQKLKEHGESPDAADDWAEIEQWDEP